MALFNGFTFDGVNSLDYGIYITGEGVYNAPERAVEMVEIQGRNGALAIDQGRWDNIEVTYHCGCFGADQADFAERIGRFRNAICSRTSYCHLTDDYHPGEYRLALCHAGVESDHVRRAGEFDIIFDCKPQRFLTSGEDTITVGDWGDVTEYSGDIVSFEGDEMTAVKSLSISLSPVQNLNGYDHPWVGGAGKNKLIYPYYQNSVTINGITATANSDGTVTVNGTCTATGSYMWLYGSSVTHLMSTLKEGETYTYSLEGAVNGLNGQVIFYGSPSTVYNVVGGNTDESVTFTVPDMSDYNGFAVVLAFVNGFTFNNVTVKPMTRLASVTDATWERYSNICPIYGRTGQTVTVTGKNLYDNATGRKNLYVGSNDSVTVGNGGLLLCFTVPKGVQITITRPNGNRNRLLWTNSPISDIVAGFKFDGYENVTSQTYTLTTQATTYAYYANTDYSDTIGSVFAVELGSTTTAYEPYAGTTYTRSFVDGQGNELTVYGGEDEIVGGVLTVEMAVVDMGTLTWEYSSADVRFYNNSVDYKRPASYPEVANAICSQYVVTKLGTLNDGMMCLYKNGYIYVKDSRYTDAQSFKTAMSGVQLCYELATPQTYQLTANEVTTLIGTNNIWSDAGEVTVEITDDPNKIVNPTLYDAKPLIKVSGYGTVQVGSVTITIEGSASDVTYIDCDSMECYRLNGLSIVSANSAVSFSSYDFPVLEADSITGVTYSTNVSQVQIVPRWWQL